MVSPQRAGTPDGSALMTVATAARRIKRFRHKFGIRAAQLEVRPRFAWYAYAAAGALAALLLVGLLYFLQQGSRGAEVRDIETLKERLVFLEQQMLQGDGVLTSLEMSNSANRQLKDELRRLADAHAVLQDDLAYVLRLVPPGVKEGETRMDRLVLRPDPLQPGHYRYSLLLGYQSGRQTQEFQGSLQFQLTLLRQGKELRLQLPGREADASAYQLSIRHWLRKEGVLVLEPGDQLKKVEVRLLQGKTLRNTAVLDL